MNKLSILLIDNRISIAAEIVRVVGEHLPEYRLSIAKGIAAAVAEPERAQVILLDAGLLDDLSPSLTLLKANYPETSIILLWKSEPERVLLEALAAGADDYVPLTEAGLLVLARRLAAFRLPQPDVQSVEKPLSRTPLNVTLDLALNDDNSPLIMQIIGADNRIQAWNQAMESFSGISREEVVGCLVEDLPISAGNLSRLKDILDQVRITNKSFTISDYPLEDRQGQTRWGRIYVYPAIDRQPATSGEAAAAVCIIGIDVTDLKQRTIESWHHTQELQILLEISREVSQQLNLKATLEKIAEQTKSLLNAETCHIYFLERDNQTLRPVLSIGPDGEYQDAPLTVGQGTLGMVAATGKSMVLNVVNTTTHPDKHLMAAPLTALKGIIGIMVVSRDQDHRSFSQDELNFFENLALQASLAINNARLFEETQRNLNELAIFYEASAAISTTWNTQEVLNTLIRQMVQGMKVSQGHIVSWNKNLQQGTVQALFVGRETLETFDGAKLNRTINLTERPAISAILNQHRPVFFQLSSRWLDESERKDMVQTGSLSRLLVPLVVKSETIGWAELWETRHERLFTPDEIRLIRMLANQAAVTLENARYLRQTRQTLEETTALYEVARALATTQDTQTIMSTVLKEYLRVLELEQGSVIIFDFDTKVGVVKVNIQDEQTAPHTFHDSGQGSPQRGLEGRQISLTNNPLYARLMQSRQPVVVEDTRETWLAPKEESGSADMGGGWAGPTAQSMLIIPIQIRGEIIGTIVVESTGQARAFENWAISLGQAMADQLSIALQNVRLYEAEYERRQQAETLRQVSFAVGSSLNLNEVLERILDQLGRVIKYDSAAIHLIEGNRRRIIAGRGFPHPEQVIGLSFPVTLDMNEPGSVAIHTRQPLVIGNIQELYDVFKKAPHNHIRSWMGIPLIARDQVIGLISIDRTELNAYNEGDVNLALAFANQVAIALENARLYELEVRQLERELEIAQGIQETLLPQITPDVPGLEICGRIIPARHIGGDFFHFFSLGENRFGVAVGDVSGKGIPAALYMAVAMTAIDAQIGETQSPGELLDRLQCTLYQRLLENKMNVALQVATFASPAASSTDPNIDGASQKAMTLASAGMIAPILATEQGCHFVPVSGLPIGTAMPNLTYGDDELLLEPSTAIIFTSDGIVEARNQAGELFGFERLERTVQEVIHSQRAETIADHIILTAEKFMGKTEQSDDMTVVVVIVKPDPSNPQ